MDRENIGSHFGNEFIPVKITRDNVCGLLLGTVKCYRVTPLKLKVFLWMSGLFQCQELKIYKRYVFNCPKYTEYYQLTILFSAHALVFDVTQPSK